MRTLALLLVLLPDLAGASSRLIPVAGNVFSLVVDGQSRYA